MSSAKIAITLDETLLARLDHLVAQRRFPSRSSAVQAALADHVERWEKSRLARECAKLDKKVEQQLAEECLGESDQWPAY